MALRIDELINSRTGVNLAAFLGRAIPPRAGHWIARLAANWIASQPSSPLVRSVRANQWVAGGESSSAGSLDAAVRAAFGHSARSIYHLYHYLQSPLQVGRLFVFDPSFEALLHRPELSERGLVITGVHSTGFDLAARWISTTWINPLALTLPNPKGGQQLEFEIRKKTGMNLVPATREGLRQAIQYLRKGGMVLTGIDHPLVQAELRPRFFGRPALLPTHYISLALKTETPVVFIFSRFEADERYHIYASTPIEMDHCAKRPDQLVANAEKVLNVAESYIRQAPQQWLMSHLVWPDILDQVPG